MKAGSKISMGVQLLAKKKQGSVVVPHPLRPKGEPTFVELRRASRVVNTSLKATAGLLALNEL